ncbi:hypothetical protein BH10PAT3_BH10PAT3_5050 [soil metagenome]
MQELLSTLATDYPDIKFVKGDIFYWSPKNSSVTYAAGSTQPEISKWSLLHEVSHGILGHKNYYSDFELMQLEVAAWQQARLLARSYGIQIDPEHIQDCLDTYRDWLHLRATCPSCGTVSAQKDPNTYECFNCRTVWHVSNSRFCRPYRRKTAAQK